MDAKLLFPLIFWGAKLEKVKFNAPTTEYRYIGAYAFRQWHNIDGISEFDDFNSMAFGEPEKVRV